MKAAVVVDTNVPIVANGAANHATPDCVLRCVDRLVEVRKKQRVLLDDGLHILSEYMKHLSLSGQPGMGDFFMKWVWLNQANPRNCLRVQITTQEGSDDFKEFPQDPDLENFDRVDRKFVAVALISGLDPPILNATDTDWWDYREPLRRNSVTVDFICPELMVPRD
ncbi:MAG: hypothetical protein DRH10_01260 [Deltaproteobacteria bacterium]|nr:MAG: hypothetical protein DRH10_01260 [Deltaproteobacteria bacterium]